MAALDGAADHAEELGGQTHNLVVAGLETDPPR
jgi:hypothetical protein